MFTGLIEEAGQVVWLRQSSSKGLQLQIVAPAIARSLRRGESVSVNGCCLTVSATHRGDQITFDVLKETLDRTNLGKLRPEASVNLERALPADGRLGGHFVQGHIDCAVPMISHEKISDDYRLELTLPTEFAHYVAFKGSIAVNGVSLTVAEKHASSFVCWIIPETRKLTNLRGLRPGDLVNLEFDILAKYIEAQSGRAQNPG